MEFDQKAALQAVSDVVKKGADVYNKIAEGKVNRQEKRLDGEIEREIKTTQAKTSDMKTKVEIIFEALNTTSDVYAKISGAVNLSRKTKEVIEKNRRQFEIDKKRLSKELEIDLEKINKDYDKEITKINNEHDEKMQHMKMWHQQEMEKISMAKMAINKLLDIITVVVHDNPSNLEINNWILCLNKSLDSLNSCNTVKYIEG